MDQTAASMNEEWRTVERVPTYEVSSLGRVRRKAGTYGCKHGRILKQKHAKGGYLDIGLSLGTKEGGYWHPHVHQLVALAFIGPMPSPEHEVRHLDGNPARNVPDNLKWGTAKENAEDRVRHGRQPYMKGELHGMARLTNSAVWAMRRAWDRGASLEALMVRYDVGRITVYDAVKHRSWKHI